MSVRAWRHVVMASLWMSVVLAGVSFADEAGVASSTVLNHAWDGAPGMDGPAADVPEGHRLVTLDVTARGEDIYEDPDDITFLLDGVTVSEYAFWDIAYLKPDGSFHSWDESAPESARIGLSRVLLVVPVPKTTRTINLSYDGETPLWPQPAPFTPVDANFPTLPAKPTEAN